VQSEANHAELALLQAIERKQIALPIIEVDFSEANRQLKKDLPNLTSLEVPHRLADAILRDSVTRDGLDFRNRNMQFDGGRANPWNALPFTSCAPTALVLGNTFPKSLRSIL
jgi:CRISPR-associated protein Csb1